MIHALEDSQNIFVHFIFYTIFRNTQFTVNFVVSCLSNSLDDKTLLILSVTKLERGVLSIFFQLVPHWF